MRRGGAWRRVLRRRCAGDSSPRPRDEDATTVRESCSLQGAFPVTPLLRDPAAQRALSREGFVVLPGLLTDALPALRDLYARAEAGLMTRADWRSRGFDELMYATAPELRREAQRALAALVAPAVARAFGDVRVAVGNLFVKRRAAPGSRVPLHQDFAIVDERAGAMSAQLWSPLVDVAEANGALGVVARSHRVANPFRAQGDASPFAAWADVLERERFERLALRAGDAVVFTGRTLHGSPPNRSNADRPALGCMLVPRAEPLLHYVRRSPTRVEAWRIDDAALSALTPGSDPAGERLGEIEHAPVAVDRAAFEALAAGEG